MRFNWFWCKVALKNIPPPWPAISCYHYCVPSLCLFTLETGEKQSDIQVFFTPDIISSSNVWMCPQGIEVKVSLLSQISLLLSLSFQNVEYSGTHATVFFLQIGAGPQEKHIRRIYWEVGGARQYNAQCIVKLKLGSLQNSNYTIAHWQV